MDDLEWKILLVPLNPLVYYVFILFRIEMTILEATPRFQTTHLEDNDSHQKIMTYIRCMCLYVLIYTGEVLVCCG